MPKHIHQFKTNENDVKPLCDALDKRNHKKKIKIQIKQKNTHKLLTPDQAGW